MRAKIILLAIVLSSTFTFAENRPFFRGPARTGVTSDAAPTEWGTKKNVKWMEPVPHYSNSSPVVWGDNVFLSGPVDRLGTDRRLYCFDRETGKVKWMKTVRYEKKELTHDTNPHGGSSPAADANRVVVWHGSAGLYCYDHAGNELWHKDLGVFSHIWGYGSSPLILGDRVIMNCGPGNRQFAIALDAKTGEILWQKDEPGGADDKSEETKSWIGSWSSPVPVTIDGKQQVLIAYPRHVNAYDPQNGRLLWFVEGSGDLSYTDPLIGEGIGAYFAGYGGAAIGFKLGGSGNMTSTNRLWRNAGNHPQRIGSGVFISDHIYMISETGIIACIDPKTGTERWHTKPAGETFWGSLVASGNKIYATSQRGNTLVFSADPAEFKLLATNSLGQRTNSTPAISNGQIFIRTANAIWCFEEK